MLKRLAVAYAAAAALGAGSVLAGPIVADSSWNGQASVTTNGVTITAYNNLAGQPGVIGIRDIPGIGVGAGVQGQGNNEIDWYSTGTGGNSEMLRFTFGEASLINTLQLGLLFDGPEYTDYQESASFKVTYADATTATYSLQALYPGNYSWNGSGAWVGSGLDSGQAGLWTGFNPFGDKGVLQIDFSANRGTCGTLLCSDQSDYVFRSMATSTVPEPGMLTLFGLGVLGAGLAGRRRRKTAAQPA